MISMLYGCGLRRSEAVAVQFTDYDQGKVIVRVGKGRKERVVYCPAGGREAIDAWIDRRGSWPGVLLRFIARLARVPPFSPHDLRRSFVGELLDAGADISSVQQLVGHSSVTTTQRYDAKRRTAELLHVPYSRPPLLVAGGPHAAPARRTLSQPSRPRQTRNTKVEKGG